MTTLQLLKKLFPQDKVKKIQGEQIYKRISREGDLDIITFYLVILRGSRVRAEINTLTNQEVEQMVEMKRLCKREDNVVYKIAFKVNNKFIFQYI